MMTRTTRRRRTSCSIQESLISSRQLPRLRATGYGAEAAASRGDEDVATVPVNVMGFFFVTFAVKPLQEAFSAAAWTSMGSFFSRLHNSTALSARQAQEAGSRRGCTALRMLGATAALICYLTPGASAASSPSPRPHRRLHAALPSLPCHPLCRGGIAALMVADGAMASPPLEAERADDVAAVAWLCIHLLGDDGISTGLLARALMSLSSDRYWHQRPDNGGMPP